MTIHDLSKLLRRHLLAAAGALMVSAAMAQDPSACNHEVCMHKGADRDARPLRCARKEGQLSPHTSFNTKDSAPIAGAFERLTGAKVLPWRSSSEKDLQLADTEARAGRHACDVFETNGPEMEALHRENPLAEFHSPYFKDLPPAAFPKHCHWVADRFNFLTIGHNTSLIEPDELPTRFQDLLHPRFAGKSGIEASDTDWSTAVVQHRGEAKGMAYFKKLAAARPQMRSGQTLLAEPVSSGEVPIAATIHNRNIERPIVKGAPATRNALNPTFGRPDAFGVVLRSAHPHAALLFADFMLPPQRQQFIKERNRGPPARLVDSYLNKFPFEMIAPPSRSTKPRSWTNCGPIFPSRAKSSSATPTRESR